MWHVTYTPSYLVHLIKWSMWTYYRVHHATLQKTESEMFTYQKSLTLRLCVLLKQRVGYLRSVPGTLRDKGSWNTSDSLISVDFRTWAVSAENVSPAHSNLTQTSVGTRVQHQEPSPHPSCQTPQGIQVCQPFSSAIGCKQLMIWGRQWIVRNPISFLS